MRLLSTLAVVVVGAAFTSGCTPEPVRLGRPEGKTPPAANELTEPTDGRPVARVGLYATVVGRLDQDERRYVYVLVNPLSNPDTQNVWWVQRAVSRQGDGYTCRCQFGEATAGRGEYFAIVAVVTDRRLKVGEKLDGIPEGMAYSKVVIVKRND
jgi:hypothetical protein